MIDDSGSEGQCKPHSQADGSGGLCSDEAKNAQVQSVPTGYGAASRSTADADSDRDPAADADVGGPSAEDCGRSEGGMGGAAGTFGAAGSPGEQQQVGEGALQTWPPACILDAALPGTAGLIGGELGQVGDVCAHVCACSRSMWRHAHSIGKE